MDWTTPRRTRGFSQSSIRKWVGDGPRVSGLRSLGCAVVLPVTLAMLFPSTIASAAGSRSQLQTTTSSGSLVANGDFSSGNTGFTSDYVTGSLYSPDTYTVGTNPAAFHGAWPSIGDHTTGTGQMMIVNGATTPNQTVWSETVSVSPNTAYTFSLWVADLVGDPASLRFSVNGTPIAPDVAPSNTGTWNQVGGSWHSGSSTSAVLSITDDNLDFGGNDFALDDISFAPVSIPVCSSTPASTSLADQFGAEVCSYAQDEVAIGNATIGIMGVLGNLPHVYQWSSPAFVDTCCSPGSVGSGF